MLRRALLAAARSHDVRRLVENNPLSRSVVNRFVAGTTSEHALNAARQLAEQNFYISLDRLGEDSRCSAQASSTVSAYQRVLSILADTGLSDRAEVSLKLSAVGQRSPIDGNKIALDNARRICQAAAAAGTVVTLDMEDHTTTDSTLDALNELRVDFPWVGAVVQADLRRTEQDCRDLATPGSRVRLCKGAYSEPDSVAFQRKHEVDRSYIRCARILMAGPGYPMVATHDPRMIAVATDLAGRTSRSADRFEFQMLYGIRPATQRQMAADGYKVRVYVPYGADWYAYFMRRLAERPANVGFFLRALLSRS